MSKRIKRRVSTSTHRWLAHSYRLPPSRRAPRKSAPSRLSYKRAQRQRRSIKQRAGGKARAWRYLAAPRHARWRTAYQAVKAPARAGKRPREGINALAGKSISFEAA